ncbi:hypothetical protein KIK84_01810 [Curvibacter sp. CHRR-16]|uniref:hypothetical protein n=1 Tax=Curvibacter sp. CHRR-16 TaxID=2835872 RepID=UPI001BDAD750|nr:hypothetical protein [Curvibacter sp. CHRR-16]MBT0569052.1 hypothetical protein [Curvibacter sp. CHRR-16]
MRCLLPVWALLLGLLSGLIPTHAQTYDRVVSLPENGASQGELVEFVRALDRATHTRTKIVNRPFARSLLETAAGKADFHLPMIQDGDKPAPAGLVYVSEVEIGRVPFVIYSRKSEPLDAHSVGQEGHIVLIEAAHASLYPFPVTESNCLQCSMDMVLSKRADALIVPMNVGDPLLKSPHYSGIHRALYKSYPVRALVPARADAAAIRRYLTEGIKQLKQSGQMEQYLVRYVDWQP